MISLRTHNILDYVVGAALILAPFLFGFSNVAFAMDAWVVVGMALIGYSLITDYRYSFARIVPLNVHMVFDVVTGLFILAAPTVYGYRAELTGFQNALHFIFGFGAIGMVALTRRRAAPPAVREVVVEEEERFDRAA